MRQETSIDAFEFAFHWPFTKGMSVLKSSLFPLLTQKPILPGKQGICLQNFISSPVPPVLIPSTIAPWSHHQLCSWTPASFSQSYWLNPQQSQRPSPTFLHPTHPIIPASNSSRHCLVTHQLSRPVKQVSQLPLPPCPLLQIQSPSPIPRSEKEHLMEPSFPALWQHVLRIPQYIPS